MKRIIPVAIFMLIMPMSYANEIAGTRVEGQGAVCAEGQGKALEVNIALKKEFSYCFLLPTPTPTPTPTPSPTSTPTSTATATPSPVSSPEPTATIEPAPVVSPTPESSTVISETTTVTTETKTVTTTPSPTPTLPSAPTMPEKSNVIVADVTAKTVVMREETQEELFDRYLRMWWSWFEELARWWASLYA